MRLLVLFWVGLLFFLGCNLPTEKGDEDRLLARVHNKTLYLSELDGMFLGNADSSIIINAYVNRWIREALLLHEAERYIPSDLKIDELVRDYRASLIRHNYEKTLVEQKLDSVISEEELADFYEENKSQYQLKTPIIRCHFIRVKRPVPNPNTLQFLWNSRSPDDFPKLLDYCNEYAEAHLLADSIWYRVDDISKELPPGTLNSRNIPRNLDLTRSDSEYRYYFKIFEVKNKEEIAPLSYIENQARKVILHSRKLKLLEQEKEKMYDLALRRNDIQVFTK